MPYNEGIKAFIATSAIEARRRVKLTSGTTTTPPSVEHAGAGEAYIGISEAAQGTAGEMVSVRLLNYPGTREVEVTVSSAIAIGTSLYGAASGCMSDASSGTAQAYAMEAADASGDHIEVLPINI